jgi:hypothetical protein
VECRFALRASSAMLFENPPMRARRRPGAKHPRRQRRTSPRPRPRAASRAACRGSAACATAHEPRPDIATSRHGERGPRRKRRHRRQRAAARPGGSPVTGAPRPPTGAASPTARARAPRRRGRPRS